MEIEFETDAPFQTEIQSFSVLWGLDREITKNSFL